MAYRTRYELHLHSHSSPERPWLTFVNTPRRQTVKLDRRDWERMGSPEAVVATVEAA